MGFYDLSKEERQKIVKETENNILTAINDSAEKLDKKLVPDVILDYASDGDTYIRKNAYMAISRIYLGHNDLREKILQILDNMLENPEERVRQTSVYSMGEIGKKDTNCVMKKFERAIKDKHPSVRNAVIGALKQMGQKNPEPTFNFARKHLHDEDPEIRRVVIHGIELRGRTHPGEVLTLLKELQDEEVKSVRNMIVHVIGQISYKEECLEKVVNSLKNWHNKELVCDAAKEILLVHIRYKFAVRSPEYAEEYIKKHLT
ncbi:sister chromatid cohesion protein PDS5 [Methanobacterium sp. SMA-27]|uniref:sister chromatid cohesion protein PDS5 n=1 Tax=Methanobacterium sp. SMA-27 TaxID=1495336 RepID=UPI00064E2453|nr:sister chromatid cohesion protein PDS5 [Methanobacterium sp. SMA-27]